eukprot:Selendium_serpulae@DN4884_c0_g1_i3.p1
MMHWNRCLILLLTCGQCLTSAGLIMGWGAMAVILKRDKVFGFLCEGGEEDCEQEDVQLSLISAVSLSFFYIMALPLGWLNDRFGPKISALYQTVAATGCLMCAVSTPGPDRFNYFFLGMILLNICGAGIAIGSFHVANLYPTWFVFICSLLSSVHSMSGIIFPIFDLLDELAVFNRRNLFGALFCVQCFFIFTSSLMPKEGFRKGEQPGFALSKFGFFQYEPATYDIMEDPTISKNDNFHDEEYSFPTFQLEQHPQRPSLTDHLCSATYMSALSYMVFWGFCACFYLTTVFVQLGELIPEEEKVEKWTTAFSWMLPIGMIGALCTGYLCDMFGYFWGYLIHFTVGTSFLFFSLIPILPVQLLTFVSYANAEEIGTAILFALIGSKFPFEHYNTLAGTVVTCLGVSLLFISPIVVTANQLNLRLSRFMGILLMLSLITVAFPVHLWYKRGERDKNVDNRQHPRDHYNVEGIELPPRPSRLSEAT